MNAKGLKNILNRISDEEAEKLTVVIEINDNAIGPTPTVGIKHLTEGFDWDLGKLIITPDEGLARYSGRLGCDNPMQKFIRKINGATICKCPICHTDIGEHDKFCCVCGQALR